MAIPIFFIPNCMFLLCNRLDSLTPGENSPPFLRAGGRDGPIIGELLAEAAKFLGNVIVGLSC